MDEDRAARRVVRRGTSLRGIRPEESLVAGFHLCDFRMKYRRSRLGISSPADIAAFILAGRKASDIRMANDFIQRFEGRIDMRRLRYMAARPGVTSILNGILRK